MVSCVPLEPPVSPGRFILSLIFMKKVTTIIVYNPSYRSSRGSRDVMYKKSLLPRGITWTMRKTT